MSEVGQDARRAYVDQPVNDAAAASRSAAAAAAHWGLGPPALHRIGMNAIYVVDDTVLRVGSPSVPASASLELARFLLGAGIDVPAPVRDDVVVVEDFSVTAWERIESADVPIDWTTVGAMVRRVHAIDPHEFPASVPLPPPSVFPWWDFEALLARANIALDDRSRRSLTDTISRHRGWGQHAASVACHGDVHPGNVVMAARGPVLLDWDLLCVAPAGWDHGPLLTWHARWGGESGTYEAFADGYGRSFADDSTAIAVAELRLVAATLMRVIAAIDDPIARPEAERRLRYWRGDADAPMWTAQ